MFSSPASFANLSKTTEQIRVKERVSLPLEKRLEILVWCIEILIGGSETLRKFRDQKVHFACAIASFLN